jgi:hypothetical protein
MNWKRAQDYLVGFGCGVLCALLMWLIDQWLRS